MKKEKFLADLYDTIYEHPDWYPDATVIINHAWTKFKDGLMLEQQYTQMALSLLTPKDARRLQKHMNREMWPMVIQQIIDLRAEGKNLKDL